MNSNRCECIRMWTIIAEKDCIKSEALRIMGYKWCEMPKNECFACKESEADCNKCPVTWASSKENGCCNNESPYNKWEDLLNPTSRIKHAREIIHLIETTWKEDKR